MPICNFHERWEFFFSGSHLKLNEIVEVFYWWACELQYSINFVDPTTGAHTQTIEGTWSQVKFMMRKRGVMNTSDDLFDTTYQNICG